MNDYVVFTPDNPNLYSLNQAARLVLAFCDGRLGSALENAYCSALDPLVSREAARAELRETIVDLERKGIVRNIGTARESVSTTAARAKEGTRHGIEKKIDGR